MQNLVTAKTVLGWSIEEFWEATPRMFYAFLFTHTQMQNDAIKESIKPTAVVGRDAINALSNMARYIR